VYGGGRVWEREEREPYNREFDAYGQKMGEKEKVKWKPEKPESSWKKSSSHKHLSRNNRKGESGKGEGKSLKGRDP